MLWFRFNIRFIAPAILCFVLSILFRNVHFENSDDTPKQLIEHRLAEIITSAFTSSGLISRAIKSDQPWIETEFTFLYRSNDSLIHWNKPIYLIPPFNEQIDSVFWIQNQSLRALYIKKTVSDTAAIFGIISLQQVHKILGRNSEPVLNKEIFEGLTTSVYPPDEPGRINISWNGKALFSVDSPQIRESESPGFLSMVLFLAGAAFLFMVRIKERKVIFTVFAVLSIVLVRLVMIYFKFPGTSGDTPLFDPSFFASSVLNDAPGNLLLNSLSLLFIVSLFSGLSRSHVPGRGLNRGYVLFITCIALLLSFAFFLLPVLFLESIYHHSVLTPDVTQSFVFGSPRLALMLAVVSSGCASFIVLRKTIPVILRTLLIYPLSLVLSALVFVSALLIWQKFSGTDHLPALYTMLAFLFLFSFRRFPVFKRIQWLKNKLAFNYLLVIGIALLCAVTVDDLDKQRNLKQLRRISSTMLNQRDEFSEYLLGLAIEEVAADPAFRVINDDPLADKQKIYERLRKKFPSGYFRGESPLFFYFEENGQPMPGTSASINELLTGFKKIQEHTNGSVWNDTTQRLSMVSRRYAAIVTFGSLRKSKIVMIVSDPFFPDRGLPVRQSMLTGQFQQPFNWNRQFSAAVFSEGNLLHATGIFDYRSIDLQKLISEPAIFYSGFEAGEYLHFISRGPSGNFLILSVPTFTGMRFVTNFSVALLIALLIMASAWLIKLIRNYSGGIQLSYADRIRLYLIGVFSVPIFILAFFVTRTVDGNSRETRSEQIRLKAVSIARDAGKWLAAGMDDDLIAANLPESGTNSGVSYIFYDLSGRRGESGDPQLRESSVLPVLVNSEASKALGVGSTGYFSQEMAGKLPYVAVWVPVLSETTGEFSGILAAHSFDFFLESEEQSINLITVIIFVLVPVFMIFLVVSHVMAYRLTRPLVSVSKALQKTNLNTLPPAGQDEMGLMVSEYNRMVENLEKSKLELVRSQRELAWREMARQVAHEIRNPLTPIRLTIQRLLTRSSAAGTHAVETEKALKSVLMQTEILSAIADSFSALSGLPALKPEKVDLMASVREDVALFMNADAGAITVTGAEDSVFIRFDRKFLSRILSNLILNARQSSVDPVDIFITIRESESGALLIVRDTGGGIEESLREKIFTPNFTTKKTGAGLGLWLCKQGIEQMGGSIRFESAASENGTTFIISWPLYRA